MGPREVLLQPWVGVGGTQGRDLGGVNPSGLREPFHNSERHMAQRLPDILPQVVVVGAPKVFLVTLSRCA